MDNRLRTWLALSACALFVSCTGGPISDLPFGGKDDDDQELPGGGDRPDDGSWGSGGSGNPSGGNAGEDSPQGNDGGTDALDAGVPGDGECPFDDGDAGVLPDGGFVLGEDGGMLLQAAEDAGLDGSVSVTVRRDCR